MRKEEVLNAIIKAKCALELERQIVGIKFLFTETEFEDAEASQPKSRLSYCNMVLKAMAGEKIKANFNNFGCFGGARALGIVGIDEFYTSGRFFKNCGLYQDLATSKKVTSNITFCKHNLYGLQIMPLEQFNNEPDIVIIVANPLNTMRIIQGYTYTFGTASNYKFIGNQAICSECTAQPYETNDINISLLCAGPRKVGFKEHEMGIGIPFNRFINVIDGICATITPVEYNERKKEIEEKLCEYNIEDVEIKYDKHYNDGFFKRDLPYFTQQRDKRDESEENID